MALNIASFRAAVDAMKVEVVAVPVPQLFQLLDEAQNGQSAIRTLSIIQSAMVGATTSSGASA